jgi:hypothetical protein
VTAGASIFAARASAAMFASVETTVRWVVTVPVRVIDTGVSADRPAATSSRAISPMVPTAESSTSVSRSTYRDQSVVLPLHDSTVTSRWFFVVSGMPAYAGTACTDETPGTISKPMPAFVQAWASSGPEA